MCLETEIKASFLSVPQKWAKKKEKYNKKCLTHDTEYFNNKRLQHIHIEIELFIIQQHTYTAAGCY